MSLLTGYYPVDARLVLDPDEWLAGGTDMGKVASVHMLNVQPVQEFLTEHATGVTPTDVRTVGVNATLAVALTDYSPKILELLTNRMSSADDYDDLNSYLLGAVHSDTYLSRVLVRPCDLYGAAVTTKHWVYVPRAVHIGPLNPVYARRLVLGSAFAVQVTGLFDTEVGGPVFFGDHANLPTLPEEEPEA